MRAICQFEEYPNTAQTEEMEQLEGKRILFLSWKDILHPSSGGAELLTDAFASSLAQKNDVTYITSAFPGSHPTEQLHGYTILRRGGLFTCIIHAFFLFRTIHKTKPFDVIIDQAHGIPFFSVFYPKAPTSLLIAYEVAGALWNDILPLPIGRNIDALWLFLYRRFTFITISPSTKHDLTLHHIPPSKIQLVPVFSDMETIPFTQKQLPVTLLVLGRIAPGKRIEHAILAFEELRQTYPNIQLVIAGKRERTYASYEKQLRDMAAKTSEVSFHINISEQQKKELLTASHVLVIPSVKEGYGLTILEAASCGTPAVGYSVAGIRDAIIHNTTGLLAEEQTPNALAKTIEDIVLDKEQYNSFQRNCLLYASKHTREQSCQAFERVVSQHVKDISRERYLYTGIIRKIWTSITMDIRFLQNKNIPKKFQFLVQKYQLLLFPSLAHNTVALWGRKRYLKHPYNIGIIQGMLMDYAYLQERILEHGVIVDVGAHIGEFALVAEVLLKPKKMLSFEPVTSSYALLEKNSRYQTFHTAIGTTLTQTMHIPSNSAMASGLPYSLRDRREIAPCIPGDDVPELTAKTTIDLLKIDVEGMEYDVIASSTELIRKSNYILIEMSVDRPMKNTAAETLGLLSSIVPSIELIHVGTIYGDDTVTDCVDLLFRTKR